MTETHDTHDTEPMPPTAILDYGPVAMDIDAIIRLCGAVDRPLGRLEAWWDGWRYTLHGGPRGRAWLADRNPAPPSSIS